MELDGEKKEQRQMKQQVKTINIKSGGDGANQESNGEEFAGGSANFSNLSGLWHRTLCQVYSSQSPVMASKLTVDDTVSHLNWVW